MGKTPNPPLFNGDIAYCDIIIPDNIHEFLFMWSNGIFDMVLLLPPKNIVFVFDNTNTNLDNWIFNNRQYLKYISIKDLLQHFKRGVYKN